MSELNVEAAVVEAVPEAVNTVEESEPKPKKKVTESSKKPSKPRKPRARKVEELIEEATKKMSDKEKDLLIAFLREDTTKLKNQIDALKQNIESAYAKVNQVQAEYEAMERFYQESLQYIDGQVIAFANAVRKSTIGGAQ